MSKYLNGIELKNISDVLKISSNCCPNKAMLVDTKLGEEINRYTYKEVDLYSRRIASYFNEVLGIKNERILLLLPNNSMTIISIFGCTYSDNMFVLGNSIKNFSEAEAKGIATKINSAEITAVLTEKDLPEDFLDIVYNNLKKLDIVWISMEDILMYDSDIYSIETESEKDDIGFIQFTSGTSNNPKGVCLSHNNFIYGIERIKARIPEKANNVMVNTLPLTHNLGLITVMSMFIIESTVVFMDVEEVLINPLLWLSNITKYKGSVTGGINLFFINAVKNIKDDKLDELDLSYIHTIFIGGEEIKLAYLRMFIDKFKRAGFKEKSFFPGYGMTENTLLVSTSFTNVGIEALHIDANKLRNNKVEITDEKGKLLISNGYIYDDEDDVIIVNPDTLEKENNEGYIGELWLSGPTVAKGYINNAEEEKERFHAKIRGCEKHYLRSGDLAFLHNKRVFITGRINDLIIIDGNNYYAHEFDTFVGERVNGVPIGNIASFPEKDSEGNEKLTILISYNKDTYPDFVSLEKISSDIANIIISNYGIPVHKIIYTDDYVIPKTSIGKIKRNSARASYMENKIKINNLWKDGLLYE